MPPQPGDRVAITTKKEQLEGTLMPSSEKGVTILKLDNGYNIGIEEKNIKSVKLISAAKPEQKQKAQSAVQKKNLPKITILHTGGTIASKVDYRTGGVVARFSPEELLALFPELKDIAQIDSRLISNMWSEDMRFAHFNIIAKEIEKEMKNGTDGIIVTHGTDALHYSAAALAFILENINIPVLLVGSQRSSDRGSTDAALNLLSAAYLITNSDFAGVGICMHSSSDDTKAAILPATKTRKMHTSRRDAFKPVNTTATAEIDYKNKTIKFLQKNYVKKSGSKLVLKPIKETLKVALVKFHPNMYAEELLAFKTFDGMLIEAYALGQGPINEIDAYTKENAKIHEAILSLSKNMPVAIASQSIYGRIQLNVYSTGRDMKSAGVLGHLSDMTPETAYIKLAWLLSNHPKDVAKLFTKNLRGEITERTEFEKEFLE